MPDACRIEYDRAFEKVRFEASIDAEIRYALHPLLLSACRDTRVTVWVMVNDVLAAMALDFLKEKGLRVPRDLSLVAFDDSSVAVHRDFSSYNFNHPAIAAAMLGTILGRKPFSVPPGSVPGFIMDRGTLILAPERPV